MAEPGYIRRVFGAPLVIAAVTFVGLLAALLGGQAWEALSWIGLAAPLCIIVLRLARRPAKRPD